VKEKIKKYAIFGVLLFIGYFFASHHVVFFHKQVNLLNKSYLTYEYTFYNLTDKQPEDVMRIDILRDDGIGDLMVELGLMEEFQKQSLESQFAYSDSDY
jgi:hypothetical protein